MADQKPKHKPQKKRTLEEVLKSLQDLIRNDLVSGQPLHPSWRESGRPKDGPKNASAETDSFHKALSKLDQIIKEKIIEPTERARETPPEPLLPDEEIEIEWDVAEPAADAGADGGDIEAADLSDLDGMTAELEEIELQPLAPDTASTVEVPVEPRSDATTVEPETGSPPGPAVPQEIPPDLVVEVIEAAPVSPPEEPTAEPPAGDASPVSQPTQEDTIDLSSVPTRSESAEDQREFDFPARSEAALPLEVAAPNAAAPEAGRESDAAADAEAVENVAAASPEDSATVDLSADSEAEAPNPAASPEQPEVAAVESRNGADAYTVEFTTEPKPPTPAAGSAPGVKTETADSARAASASAEAASQPPDESAVKKRPTPSDSAKHDKPPSERGDTAHGAPDTEPSIPVLKDVADLKTPPAPPLPEVSQARDIAIRVIARLNIERRKSGEKPLDIKTIERLQQYLADALNKRALNKK
jgi:hypothetical protein